MDNSEITAKPSMLVVGMSVEDHDEQRDSPRECAHHSCRRRAGKNSELCPKHEDALKRRKRDHGARRRALWASECRCMRCGAEKRKRGSRWCAACLIWLDKLRKPDQEQQRDSPSKRERIASRLIPWEGSPQNEGRLRLRGGKRGAPSMEDRDRRDLEDMQKGLVRYGELLDEAYGAETRDLSRVQQVQVRRAAHARLALVVRQGLEALRAYGYDVPIAAGDEIADSDDTDDT